MACCHARERCMKELDVINAASLTKIMHQKRGVDAQCWRCIARWPRVKPRPSRVRARKKNLSSINPWVQHHEISVPRGVPGLRRTAQPRPARVSAGRDRGHGEPVALHLGQQALCGALPPRPADRTRARDHVPRLVGGRPWRGPGQPRLPHPAQLRHRPLQGRPALPPLGEPVDPEVPRLRADLQERAHHAAHGRRQGRFRLRSQGPQPG